MDGNRNETEKQPDGCGNEGICKQDGRGEASIGVRKPSGMIACPHLSTSVDKRDAVSDDARGGEPATNWIATACFSWMRITVRGMRFPHTPPKPRFDAVQNDCRISRSGRAISPILRKPAFPTHGSRNDGNRAQNRNHRFSPVSSALRTNADICRQSYRRITTCTGMESLQGRQRGSRHMMTECVHCPQVHSFGLGWG